MLGKHCSLKSSFAKFSSAGYLTTLKCLQNQTNLYDVRIVSPSFHLTGHSKTAFTSLGGGGGGGGNFLRF